MAVKSILKELVSLSKEELKVIATRTTHLLNYGAGNEVVVGLTIAQDLYTAMCVTLKNQHVTCPPWVVFQKSINYTEFLKHVQQLAEFIKQQPKMTRVEGAAFYQFSTALLATALRRQGIPVALRTMCTNIHRLPEVIDDAFPGYLEAGMLSWILTAMHAPKQLPL